MNMIEEIINKNCGAKFRRADLHIHSFGGSYDVTDNDMTPENIVEVAKREGLDVISITDHNSIENVQKALEFSQKRQLLVIPGIELSTPQGHLLVYFPDLYSLEKFYGTLNISKDKKSCHELIPVCLNNADKYGGIGIAPHIDKEATFECLVPNNEFKEEIIKTQNLLALEITNIENETWYSERDINKDRKQIFIKRREIISDEIGYEIAKVMFSDAHTLSALGRNASGDKKITRLKMDTLSFDSFRIALLDSTARVRIEELIPIDIPKFIGIKFEGGFLNGQIVKFSNNLTCIIGGRGTGKSTLIESLRATSGNKSRKNLVDCEAWPDRVSLIFQDEIGRQQVLVRDKFGVVKNLTDPESGITNISIESYGQGETAETIQHCDKNPNALLNFLDDFIEFGTLKSDDEKIREKLLENQQIIKRLIIEVSTIPDVEKAYKNALDKLKTLKTQNASKVVELEESLSKERHFRSELINKLNELVRNIKEGFTDTQIKELVEELDGSLIVAGKTEFESIKEIMEHYSDVLEKVSEEINQETKKVIDQIKEQLRNWQEKEKEIQDKIESIRKELEGKGIKLDMAFIRKITSDVTNYDKQLKELQKKKGALNSLWKTRRDLLKKRRDIKSQIFLLRNRLAIALNNNLKATVVDFFVSVKFREGLLSPTCQKIIQDAMGWRTSQVPKAEYIASQISVFELLDAIKTQDIKKIIGIKDINGTNIFSEHEANIILDKLSSVDIIFELQRCDFEDRPEITVTKVVKLPDGKEEYVSRNFSKLSLGQQQSILLSILLYSESTKPLIIDQPEDNLDSEFIYRTLVRNLRRVKERRQVIIATHNANIAVLGDAELIIPLKSTSDRAVIMNRGSIDNPETKTIACDILEGSEQAFKKRKEIYGL